VSLNHIITNHTLDWKQHNMVRGFKKRRLEGLTVQGGFVFLCYGQQYNSN